MRKYDGVKVTKGALQRQKYRSGCEQTGRDTGWAPKHREDDKTGITGPKTRQKRYRRYESKYK